MNVELLTKVRDALVYASQHDRELPLDLQQPKFDMMVMWSPPIEGHSCETAMCIAGLTVVLAGEDPEYTDAEGCIISKATELLEISELNAENLFFAKNSILGWSRITPEMATYAVNHLLETGEVEWPEEYRR